MSELLRRAAELKQAAQRQQGQDAQRRAREEAERNTVQRAAREDSQRQVADFVGAMLGGGVPTIPLYQEIRQKGFNPGNMATHVIPDQSLRWERRADGWLVRKPHYPYDQEPVVGLFVARNNDYYTCREPLKTGETGLVPAYVQAGIRTPEFVITDPFYENVGAEQNPTSTFGAHFAGAVGEAILAQALVDYKVV